MLVNKAIQFAVLAAAVLLDSRVDAATSPSVKFCGRQLGEIMSRVCHAYNSPWDTPTVVEQPSSIVRRRRQVGNGIADECCNHGCTWEQLSEYCSISANSESPLEDMEAHIIADRSAEQGAAESKDAASPAAAPAAVGSAGYAGRGAGGARGRARSRGYGRARPRGRRCWCRRKRRSGRRRSSLMGPRKKCSTRCSRGGHRITSNHVGPDTQH
uniref:Insulin-like domain-containing protein n=1 Tax=Heliothis virescens TaxID=7102 RepID=A0A2A4JZE6_HELVI